MTNFDLKSNYSSSGLVLTYASCVSRRRQFPAEWVEVQVTSCGRWTAWEMAGWR